MFIDAMAPGPQNLQNAFPAQSAAVGESAGESGKWSVSARLRLIILPTATFWVAAIWLVVSLF